MFRVVACELTVMEEGMSAVITLSGTGYDMMYLGSAATAPMQPRLLIFHDEDAEGKYTFRLPVSALDEEQSYAAHAVKSGKWFDRTLTFLSDTAVAK